MSKYIELDAVIQALESQGITKNMRLHRKVRELHAADVAPVVHGLWIGEGDGYSDGAIVYDVWYCSECDYCIDDGTDDPDFLPRYCPNCGAKMDKEDN